MTVLQIVLIIIGILFIVASFFVSEKLTKTEVDQLSRLSSEQLQKVAEKEMSTISDRVGEIVAEAVEQSVEDSRRPMELLSNEKIMAINEYSDTVLENINKNHNEIMFLYSMLNDKQEEMKEMLSVIDRNKAQLREMTDELSSLQRKEVKILPEEPIAENAVEEDEDDGESGFIFKKTPEEIKDSEDKNDIRQEVLRLFEEGLTPVEIGKQLNKGVGEVKLIIDLDMRGGNNEA